MIMPSGSRHRGLCVFALFLLVFPRLFSAEFLLLPGNYPNIKKKQFWDKKQHPTAELCKPIIPIQKNCRIGIKNQRNLIPISTFFHIGIKRG
jgi:hypothetical protein